MPTPTKKLLYTTARIEATLKNGATSTGTSFLFEDAAAPPQHRLFLVSNKHVVEDTTSASIGFTTVDANNAPVVGQPFEVEIDNFAAQWHGHPNPDVDIAVMPLSWQLDLIAQGGIRPYLTPVRLEDMADPSIFENLDVTAPVVFVGYPNGMFDEENYLPIFRRGYVASSPDRDFDGRPVFLIDASVFPGSSGSPVFTVGDSLIAGTPALKFLGVISSAFAQQVDGKIVWTSIPTTSKPVPVINQLIDLGVVFKARCVREALTDWRLRRFSPSSQGG